MSKIWPKHTIRELIALAECNGMSRAELSSADEAARFRFAIYNFRRENDVGQNIVVTVEDNSVILVRQDRPEITISSEAVK